MKRKFQYIGIRNSRWYNRKHKDDHHTTTWYRTSSTPAITQPQPQQHVTMRRKTVCHDKKTAASHVQLQPHIMMKTTATERWQHEQDNQHNNDKMARTATSTITQQSTNEKENTEHSTTISNKNVNTPPTSTWQLTILWPQWELNINKTLHNNWPSQHKNSHTEP